MLATKVQCVAVLKALRPMGRYTQVGICGREIAFPIDQIFYKQLKLAGSSGRLIASDVIAFDHMSGRVPQLEPVPVS
jgi:threonine dehydrogenase-like Zn-dependent dehydrogenase